MVVPVWRVVSAVRVRSWEAAADDSRRRDSRHVFSWSSPLSPISLCLSARQGPIDISKAQRLMVGWKPTPFKDVVAEAVPWYEAAMVDPKFVKVGNG